VFLIHNLIEFSMFEAGPLCLVGVLFGSALGIRLENPPVRKPHVPPAIGVTLAIGILLWLAALNWIAVPVCRAEAAAHAGDDKLRAGDLLAASDEYGYAWSLVPYNADYAFRAGRALHFTIGPEKPLTDARLIDNAIRMRSRIMSWYDVAIERNPSFLTAYHFRAVFELQENEPVSMVADFDKVMELNPNEVSLRLEYARDLQLLDMDAEARKQFELALKYNDLLDKDEPKRLSADEIAEIKSEMAVLR
jgi:hypothetical protein